jgi:hypothetical protein
MKPSIVSSVAELTEVAGGIFSATSKRWWFRGQKNADWDLLPSIKRGHSRQQERYLTNLFYTGAQARYPNCPPSDDYGAWLALMQHYGLPTRLLDWTHSLLVGAYFAIKYSFDMDQTDDLADAAIWMLDPTGLNESQGYEPVFPPLNARSVEPLVRPALKGDDASTLAVLAVAPIESDMKMFAQQGAFTIHVADEPLNLMTGREEWLRKIIVPERHVPAMAMELDVLGARLAGLFPDLYHLAREIKKQHKPA